MENTINKVEHDMRVHVPIERHKRLIQMFKDLPVKESFIFINDHDPIPLYYEFRSIFGDVVGWNYLNKGGIDWKVEVTKIEASQGREFKDISTLIDLRKADEKEWKHIVFHRFGMMEEGDVMELIAASAPKEIHAVFVSKFEGEHSWIYKKQDAEETVVHITKINKDKADESAYKLIDSFDLRPYPPTQRHEMFYEGFAKIRPGEAFEFINDHDPLPLYYQMEAESEEPFLWEYVDKGPVEWKVRVIKSKQ